MLSHGNPCEAKVEAMLGQGSQIEVMAAMLGQGRHVEAMSAILGQGSHLGPGQL